MQEIKLNPVELGHVVSSVEPSVDAYNFATLVNRFIEMRRKLAMNDQEFVDGVLADIQQYLQSRKVDQTHFKVTDFDGMNIYIKVLSDDLGRQQDLFGKQSILPILRNAGLR
jgi:exoribonuclease II